MPVTFAFLQVYDGMSIMSGLINEYEIFENHPMSIGADSSTASTFQILVVVEQEIMDRSFAFSANFTSIGKCLKCDVDTSIFMVLSHISDLHCEWSDDENKF